MNIDRSLLVTSVEAATDFEHIRILLHDDCIWDDCEEEDILPSITKMIDLAVTFEQGHALQRRLFVSYEPWSRLIAKMVDLAQSETDLEFFVDDYYQSEILNNRELIRRVFDRADALQI